MLSLLAVNQAAPSSVVQSSSFAFPSLARTVTNFTVHGFRATSTTQQERRRVGFGVRRREARRRAVSEHLESRKIIQKTLKNGLEEQGKLRFNSAPSRDGDQGERDNAGPLLQERVKDDLVRRYWLDKHSGAVTIEEVNISSNGRTGTARSRETVMLPFGTPLPKVATDFILPGGFPDTVSSDYLQYMLWQFPTNVTGWICSTLVTSSLFKGLGVGVDAGYAAAATATIKKLRRSYCFELQMGEQGWSGGSWSGLDWWAIWKYF